MITCHHINVLKAFQSPLHDQWKKMESTKRRYVSPLGKAALSHTDMVKYNTKKSLISAEGKKFWELTRVQIKHP